jgi:hypothetical protein
VDRHLSPDSCEWDAGQSVSGGSCSVVANSLSCYSSIALPCSCDLVVQIIIQREQQGRDLSTVNLLFLLPGASIGIDGAAKGRQRSGAARCTSGPTSPASPAYTADLATRADGIDHGFGAPHKVQRLGTTLPRAPVVKWDFGSRRTGLASANRSSGRQSSVAKRALVDSCSRQPRPAIRERMQAV